MQALNMYLFPIQVVGINTLFSLMQGRAIVKQGSQRECQAILDNINVNLTTCTCIYNCIGSYIYLRPYVHY